MNHEFIQLIAFAAAVKRLRLSPEDVRAIRK